MESLISIIIPCFNQGKFLNETLMCVFNQTYPHWECIIVDDGSTDNSKEIAEIWENKDNRFNYFYKKNKGVSAARNFALEKVKGKYIQFLDADDILSDTKLEVSIEALQNSKNKDEKLVISNFRMFSTTINKTTDPYCILKKELFNYESLLYKWNECFSIPIHCGFFESSLFEEVRFPENLTAQEDWIVWVNLFKLRPKTIFLEEPLALYRQNPESRTMTKSLYDDQILAYQYFKETLEDKEFYTLSEILISRYYKKQEEFKKRLSILKNSNPYQAGMMIKKGLKIVGLLNLSRKIFPFFLKLKSK